MSYEYDMRLRLWGLSSAKNSSRLMWSPSTAEERKWYTIPVAAFSPDGRLLAAGFYDGSTRLWDTASDRTVVRKEHTATVMNVSFSDNGRWLLTEDTSGKVCLWKSDSGFGQNAPRCYEHASGARLGGTSPLFVAPDGSKLRVWDLNTHGASAEPLVIDTGVKQMRGIAWDPEGRWLAAYGDSIVVWRRATAGSPAAMLKLQGAENVFAVHVSRDGRWLAAEGGWKPAYLWDLLTPVPQALVFSLPKTELQRWGDVLAVYRPDFGPAALSVLYAASGSTSLWVSSMPRVLPQKRPVCRLNCPRAYGPPTLHCPQPVSRLDQRK